MTRYLAVTTCNGEQWTKHGRTMATTFCQHWPNTVILAVYCEDFWPKPGDASPVHASAWVGYEMLGTAAPWLEPWKERYRDQRYRGGPNRRDYRHDAVRFSHKIAAIGAAAEMSDCDVLIWIDADTVTHSDVTEKWLGQLFPEPAVVAWLDREGTYPECGLVMFRMPAARQLIRDIVTAYRSGAIFQLPQWHDSYVIQQYVLAMKLPTHSLSGREGRKHIGHPWLVSELAAKMDHLKGETRKAAGKSTMGAGLKARRPEPYWQG